MCKEKDKGRLVYQHVTQNEHSVFLAAISSVMLADRGEYKASG